jgi:Rieske Fe-S protein
MDAKLFYLLSLILFFTIALIYVNDSKEPFKSNIIVKEIMNGNAFKVLANGKNFKLSRKCPHQGCNVDWDSNTNKFVCPCHKSMFDVNGKVLQGPATTNMKLL